MASSCAPSTVPASGSVLLMTKVAVSRRPHLPPTPRSCLRHTLSHLALRRHAGRLQARQTTSTGCIRSLCSHLMGIYPT